MKIKWTGTEVAIIVVFVWIVFFGGMGTLRDLLTPTIPTPEPKTFTEAPTPNIKMVLDYTPTPGAGGGSQLSTAQAKFLPTPRTVITIGDAKGFALAMYPKLTTLPIEIRLFAERSGPGSAVFCATYTAKLGPSFCAYSTGWFEWRAGMTEKTFQSAKIIVSAKKKVGSEESEIVVDGNNARQIADVEIIFEKWGLDGPIVRDDNQSLYTVKDFPDFVLKEMSDDRSVLLEETRQTANNAALYLARWDSLVGVWRMGGKMDYSGIEDLRATMEKNLNSGTIPDLNAYKDKDMTGFLTPKQQLLAIAQAQARKYGFDSVGSLTIRVAPLVPGQVVYVSTMDEKTPAQLNFDAAVKRYGESSEQWSPTKAELAIGGTK
jgi:hypothetical protein